MKWKTTPEDWEGKGWIRQGLYWGLFMYVFMVLLFPLLTRDPITLKEVLVGIPFWTLGGLGYGYVMKWIMQRKKKS
jgi:hypothetical protein